MEIVGKRKKKHEHEHIDESWLIPYADLLTLLLALFIVLFAASNVDVKKFEAMSQVFNEIFTGGTGVMEYQSPVEPTPAPTVDDEIQQEKESNQEAAYKQDQEELKEIQSKINHYIEVNKLDAQFATDLTSEGLLITIRDNVLFASGSATVDPRYLNVAGEVSRLLEMDPPRNVIISGHTDNVPISTAEFGSNWELSVMRAVNFMKILMENKNLDPKWFSAKGFGEYKPTATNDTSEGRAKNRRVEVLVLPRVAAPE